MSPASGGADPAALTGPGLAAAIAAVAVAVDRIITGRRRDRTDAARELAQRTTDLMASAVALADERREGEHDCRAELAELRGEVAAMRASHRMEMTEMRAELADCQRKHAAVEARLQHGGFPEQHGGSDG